MHQLTIKRSKWVKSKDIEPKKFEGGEIVTDLITLPKPHFKLDKKSRKSSKNESFDKEYENFIENLKKKDETNDFETEYNKFIEQLKNCQ